MYYKKLTIGIAALMLAIVSSMADCMDPTDPNCISTNPPPNWTNSYTSAVYTNGELHLIVSKSGNDVSMLLTNGSLLEDYVIDRSTDLLNWSQITAKFETGTNGSVFVNYTDTDEQAYYRARVATYVEYANIGGTSGSFDCGSYVGYGNFYGFQGAWGYGFNSNVTRHVIYDGSGNTNRLVSYLASSGQHGCGTYQCTVQPSLTMRYRFSLFAVTGETVPQSNQPLRMKGIEEDAPTMLRSWEQYIAWFGPGPNEQGFFY